MPSWVKPWHPPGLDEVRRTVDAAAPKSTGAPELPPLSPEDEERFNARAEQDRFEDIERAREQGRQETLNQDQFREGWDAGQEALKRQNAAKRKLGVKGSSSVRRAAPKKLRSSSSVARSTNRSAGSAFRRRR